MLRRKLLIRIGLLVTCFVAGAVVAIWAFQGALTQIDRINREGLALVEGVHRVEGAIARVEDVREGIVADTADPGLVLNTAIRDLAAQPALQIEGSGQSLALAQLEAMVPTLLNIEGTTQTQQKIRHAVVRSAAADLGREVQAHIAREQTHFSGYLRWLVVGMTLGALVMMNVAVVVLVRTAQVVLKPVGALVTGSRELAAEHFDHRVEVDQQDEFGELARAYNRMAEQLQAIEERKAETLRQLAVTLNHDLNNALATVEMQLSLLDRESGRDKNLAKYFKDIHSTLSRMSSRIASLKEIRRVVLTDYVDGQKMVDLEQSVAPAP